MSELNAWKGAGTGALALGATGFVCGFFGPIALNPDANQGPLLGLLITGPGGALLGAGLGLAAGAVGLSWGRFAAGLAGLCAAGGLVILYFCLPEPQYRAVLVELEVLACEAPLARKEAAFALWEKRIAAVTWSAPPPDWKEAFERAAAEPGAALKTRVIRRRELLVGRKPWDRGTPMAGPWTSAPDRRAARPGEYFARGSCAGYPAGLRGTFLARGEEPSGWPPRNVSNFLDLQLIEPVPVADRGFLD